MHMTDEIFYCELTRQQKNPQSEFVRDMKNKQARPLRMQRSRSSFF